MSLAVAVVAALALVLFVLFHFLLPVPPTISFTADVTQGKAVNMTIQVDPANGPAVSSQPGWPSYFVENPTTHKFVRSTIWQLPAHTRINVTLYQYDGCTPLRNQFWGKTSGTTGGVSYVNGHRQSLSNSYAQCSVAHTFTVPSLGINVPLAAVNAANLCGQGPCTTKSPHEVQKFSFVTPGAGEFRWQCFIPCGLGFLDGNGGPMQTLGFMSGFLKVVAS